MNRATKTIAFLAPFLAWGCASPDEKALEKLQGNWIQTNQETPLIEMWTKNDDGVYHGRGGKLAMGDTAFYEQLLIDKSNENYRYTAIIPNREPVIFTLVRCNPTYLEWFNANNDFPKTISYTFDGNTKLLIILSGSQPNDTLQFTKNH